MIDPLYIISAAFLIVMVILIMVWNNPLAVLGTHISSRVILDGFSSITYEKVILNLSIMQIYSIGIIIFLTLYIALKKERDQKLFFLFIPVMIIIISYVFSGFINNDWLPVIEKITMWIYLVLLSGFIVYILQYYHLNSLIFVLWISLLPAVVIQIVAILSNDYSIAAGGHKTYSGGYAHQFMLSYLLLGFTFSSIYISVAHKNIIANIFFILCAFWGMIGIYLCGYRSSLLALLVFLSFAFAYYISRSNVPRKFLALYFIPVFMASIFYYLGADFSGRMYDIWLFIQSPSSYIDFSGDPEVDLIFSGRIYIINTLMAAYLSSPMEAIIFGMGIESSDKIIGTYAHNEYVSALVETGIFGIFSFSAFIIFYLYTLLKNKKIMPINECIVLSFGIGLLVMSLSTMPFRCMRAMMLIGIVFGIMYYRNSTLKINKSVV